MNVRRPAVAGRFYPADPERLRAEVSKHLAAVAGATGLPKALIAPHAGYVYSGGVAACAFATLHEHASAIRRVVVIGPAHYVPLRGIAAPLAAYFETPLGRVPVDEGGVADLATLPYVIRSDIPHAPEHALEVELPFLQMLVPSFRIVPLLVGDAEPRQVAETLQRLWDAETLIVVSSDLSHYHDYATAQRLDAATAAAIERGEAAALGPKHACGYLAIAGLLLEADRRRLSARRLALCNSGDTAGPRDEVVGYGAWSFH
jgi:AmmeMemoRadiSam system protein B